MILRNLFGVSPSTLSRVVGENVKRLRKDRGASLEHFADGARFFGLPWTASTVSDIESGRRSPTLSTLLVLLAVLNGYHNAPNVRLSDLLAGSAGEVVALNDAMTAVLSAVRGAVNGKPFLHDALRQPDGTTPAATTGALRNAEQWAGQQVGHYGLADKRAARALGLDDLDMFVQSFERWGHTLTAERDARAEDGATAQRLGRITRELVDELRTALGGHRGND